MTQKKKIRWGNERVKKVMKRYDVNREDAIKLLESDYGVHA